MKLWHDVGRSCWEGGEEEIAQCRRLVGRAVCYSDKYLEHAWVDICAGGVACEVVTNGASVGYCGIL